MPANAIDMSVVLSPGSVQLLKILYRLGKAKPEARPCNTLNTLNTTTRTGDSLAGTGIRSADPDKP